MNRSLVFALATLLSAIPALLSAGELTPEDQEFFKQHASDMVRFETETLDDLAVEKVFSAPVYSVKVILPLGDGSPMTTFIVTRNGEALVALNQPGTDGDLPDFAKMISPEFKLRTNTDGKMLQQALNVLFPVIMESEKKLRSFRHTGNTWTFVRGEFFDSKSGYIFTTDESGTIVAVSYQLKLP